MSNLKFFFCLLLAIAVTFSPVLPRVGAAPQQREPAPGDANKPDPCTLLPSPPGNANGIDKQCSAPGSSSGVAKGDFNGDGFADLAIGEPGAAVGSAVGAGDVFVIYGSPNGLAPSGTDSPRSRPLRAGIPILQPDQYREGVSGTGFPSQRRIRDCPGIGRFQRRRLFGPSDSDSRPHRAGRLLYAPASGRCDHLVWRSSAASRPNPSPILMPTVLMPAILFRSPTMARISGNRWRGEISMATR